MFDVGVLTFHVGEQVPETGADGGGPAQLASGVAHDVVDDVGGEGGERAVDVTGGFLAKVRLDDLIDSPG
jgi:hypothetical protein